MTASEKVSRLHTAGLRVKPLAWHWYDLAHDNGKGLFEANNGFGDHYEVQDCADFEGSLQGRSTRWFVPQLSLLFMTSEEAMAACQAHLEEGVAASLVLEGPNRVEEEMEERRRAETRAADRFYMLEAYRSMLGPNGLAVVKVWDDAKVVRVHYSWGPEASSLTGEERAAYILEVETAPRTHVNTDADGDF